MALSVAAADPDNGALCVTTGASRATRGSDAEIDDPDAETPSFTPDVDGVYVVQVIVRDGLRPHRHRRHRFPAATAAATQPPIADAGVPQTVLPGNQVQLDGTGSSDPETEPLTYAWIIVSKPVGSAAALSNPAAVQPTVTIDLPGAYVFELIVNDGHHDSAPTKSPITGNGPPTANAGHDQVVDVNTLVQLTGTGSSDPEPQPLTYQWSFARSQWAAPPLSPRRRARRRRLRRI